MFASEGAELAFGTLDAQAIAQFNYEETAGRLLHEFSLLGRGPRDQLRTAGIASTKRRNE
jgi:hypothetical protein